MLIYYLEYNSTINCSLIFSGIISLEGVLITLPVIVDLSQSNQSYFFELADNEFVIASMDPMDGEVVITACCQDFVGAVGLFEIGKNILIQSNNGIE